MTDKDTVQEQAASTVFVGREVQKVLTAVQAVRTEVAQAETRLTDKIGDARAELTGKIDMAVRWLIGVGLTAIGLLVVILWRGV